MNNPSVFSMKMQALCVRKTYHAVDSSGLFHGWVNGQAPNVDHISVICR